MPDDADPITPETPSAPEPATPAETPEATGGGLLDDLVPPDDKPADAPGDAADTVPGDADDAATPPAGDKPAQDDKPAEPAKPAPKAEEKPEARADELDAEGKAIADRLAQYKADRDALRKKITDKTYDPFDDGPEKARLDLEREDLSDAVAAYQSKHAEKQQAAESERKHAEGYWEGFTKQYPAVGVDKGKALWTEAVASVRKDYPDASDESVRIAATERWKSTLTRVAAATRTAPATPAKPAANKTPAAPAGRTAITPAAGVAKPAPKSETAAERVLRTIGPVSAWRV